MPIAVLIDELKHEDVQSRLRSVQRLGDIAEALGAIRTRDELIPFLSNDMDDDDEVLREFASQLGHLLEAVGGAPHAMTLLVPLEQLASVEDTDVRESASSSIATLARAVSVDMVVSDVVPLLQVRAPLCVLQCPRARCAPRAPPPPAPHCRHPLTLIPPFVHGRRIEQRLAGREWFTARISACTLCPLIYAALASSGAAAPCSAVRKVFLELVGDETPMVRRAAMIALGPLAKAMGAAHVAGDEEMLSAFIALSEDQQDSVRLFAIDGCVDLAGVLPTALSKERVLPRALKLAKDASWRVRWSVANKFVALCGAAADSEPGNELLDAHKLLLQDSEMEVRTVAAVTVAEMAKNMSPARVRTQLLPLVAKLVSDECEHVRVAVASVIMALGATVSQMGDSSLLMTEMVPLYLELLKDPKSDVRLNIIAKLGDGGKGVDRELSKSLQPAINDLAQDRQWRVRVAVIELMPSLAERLGEDFFTDELRKLCLASVRDRVFAVRRALLSSVSRKH